MRGLLIAAILLSSVSAIPAVAQSDVLSLRVDRLEKEMKAVQRKVFPLGAAVEPEIGSSAQANSDGTPATAPITDLTARVDALESQLKSLTGQTEQNTFRLKKLEDALKATDARVKSLEAGDQTATPTAAEVPVKVATPAPKPLAIAPKPVVAKPTALAPPAAATATKPTVAAKPDATRKAAIAAVEVPSTGDAAEDSYTYGFRLYTAKLYPEAQVKLKEMVAKYASHKRASYAQNLLGRAYFDEGKPALAAVAFYDNYQKMPRGDRASESLYWLGIALTKLKKPADACKVYSEFGDVYGAKASSDLKAKVAKGRADAKCTA